MKLQIAKFVTMIALVNYVDFILILEGTDINKTF